MTKDFKNLLRISAGVAVLLVGIIGLFIPILQGGLLIVAGVILISPAHGRKFIAKIKEWFKGLRHKKTSYTK